MLLHVSLCIFPSVWWLRMKLQWTFARRFVWTYAFVCLFKFVFLLCKFLSMKILDCILSVCLIQKRNCQAFFQNECTILLFNCSGEGVGTQCWLFMVVSVLGCTSVRAASIQSAVEFSFVSIWRLPMVTASESSSVHLYDDQLWSPINLIVSLPI